MNRTAKNRSLAVPGMLVMALSGVAGFPVQAQPALDPLPNPASDPLNGPTVVPPPPPADAQSESPRLLLPGQPPPPGAADARRDEQPPGSRQTFTQPELDEMLAPIALYPDSLLSQVLMASTYPVELVQADRWRRGNANLAGDALAGALEEQPWDPSVKSLVNTPDVLAMMSDKLDWTVRLGDAFIGQQQQVMDTVQDLRKRAQEAGTLKTTREQRVTTLVQAEPVVEREIVIERTDPDVIYVPVYDPYVAYGPWWHPYYRPFFWCPPTYPIGWTGIWFGLSYHCGPPWGYAWGHPDWHHHRVDVDVNRHARFNTSIDRAKYQQQIERRDVTFHADSGAWVHDPSHRRGVWYRDTTVAQRFGAPTPPQLTRPQRDTFRTHTVGPVGSGTEALMGPRVTTPSNAGRTTNTDGYMTNSSIRDRQRQQQTRSPVQAPGLTRDDASPNQREPRVRADDDARIRQSIEQGRARQPNSVRVQPDQTRDRGAAFSDVDRDGGSVRIESRRGSVSREPSESFRSAPEPRSFSAPAPSMRSSSPPPSRSSGGGDGGGGSGGGGSRVSGGGGGGGSQSNSSPAPAPSHGSAPRR